MGKPDVFLPSRWIRQCAAWLRDHPTDSAAIVAALTLSLLVIVGPFFATDRPPLVDLPTHAAQISIFRHYFDPAFHFREQFTLHPLQVPYLSMFAVGSIAALVFPITGAAKISVLSMLCLLPVGLAVFFLGMKKSPYWGLLGLGLIWTEVLSWGFASYLGALGLSAMAIGIALMVLDSPSRKKQIALALVLLVIFFTHIYRLPFTLLCIGLTAGVLYPACGRLRPVLLPMLPALLALSCWLGVRTVDTALSLGELRLEIGRLPTLGRHVFGSYLHAAGARETQLGGWLLTAAAGLGLLATALFFVQGRHRTETRRKRYWGAGVTALPALIAVAYLFTFLVLPLNIGQWYFVYPREAVSVVFFALGMMPDLPRAWSWRVPMFAVVAATTLPMSSFVFDRWSEFQSESEQLDQAISRMRPAPKLSYLIFEPQGDTSQAHPPVLHFPAWVQAELGGAQSFSVLQFGHSPIRYRKDSTWTPPLAPARWEWTPQQFDIGEHGTWFDTFLVRMHSNVDPSSLFHADPSIRLSGHFGRWWLFSRDRTNN